MKKIISFDDYNHRIYPGTQFVERIGMIDTKIGTRAVIKALGKCFKRLVTEHTEISYERDGVHEFLTLKVHHVAAPGKSLGATVNQEIERLTKKNENETETHKETDGQ